MRPRQSAGNRGCSVLLVAATCVGGRVLKGGISTSNGRLFLGMVLQYAALVWLERGSCAGLGGLLARCWVLDQQARCRSL